MAQTNLPTPVSPSPTGHLGYHTTIHAALNDLSRDTGLRNITALLINGWVATSVHLVRERDWVHLIVRGLDGTSATSAQMFAFGASEGQIPTGFRAIGNSFEEMLRAADGSTTYVRVDTNSILGQMGVNYGGYNRTISWRSTSTFPTTLPGNAV